MRRATRVPTRLAVRLTSPSLLRAHSRPPLAVIPSLVRIGSEHKRALFKSSVTLIGISSFWHCAGCAGSRSGLCSSPAYCSLSRSISSPSAACATSTQHPAPNFAQVCLLRRHWASVCQHRDLDATTRWWWWRRQWARTYIRVVIYTNACYAAHVSCRSPLVLIIHDAKLLSRPADPCARVDCY